MNFIDKIIGKINFSFLWKDNIKTIHNQKCNDLQVNQEKGGITNIIKIENITVTSINELAGLNDSLDPEGLIKNAGQRFLMEQKVKQHNFKMAVDGAELDSIAEPKTVDSDWFFKWMEISQCISRKNIQDILSKILSGEVNKTGSFSLRTLEVLKNLSKDEISIFQKFCDVSFNVPSLGDMFTVVICDPFGRPGNNALTPFGLSYSGLCALQDAGLIQNELSSYFTIKVPLVLQMPFKIGNIEYCLKPTEETITTDIKVNIINFTIAGLELRSVLSIGSNLDYNTKVLEWIKEKTKMI